MKKLALLTICVGMTMGIFAQNAEIDKNEQAKSPLNKEQLVGIWKTANTTYTLDRSGASLVTLNNRSCPGTWVLEGNKLTISPKQLKWKKDDPCSTTMLLEVKSLSTSNLEVIESSLNREIQLVKHK
jgi:hypothetical protein